MEDKSSQQVFKENFNREMDAIIKEATRFGAKDEVKQDLENFKKAVNNTDLDGKGDLGIPKVEDTMKVIKERARRPSEIDGAINAKFDKDHGLKQVTNEISILEKVEKSKAKTAERPKTPEPSKEKTAEKSKSKPGKWVKMLKERAKKMLQGIQR